MKPVANEFVHNILFCGCGGQGVLTAAEICGRAAIKAGFHVKMSAVHGMAQRGGSVESHRRFGKAVASPMIPCGKVHWLVCMDETEGLRHFSQLDKKGIDFTPFLKMAGSLLSDKRTLNIFMLGVLSTMLSIKEKFWIEAIREVLPEKIALINEKVFGDGVKTVESLRS